jgi:drug/metabolite transporter (DMT)-like permease
VTIDAGATPPSSEFAILSAAIAAILIWGATAVVTKVAVGAMDPIAVGILRTVIAVPLALPVILLRRLAPPRGRQIFLVAVTAATGLIGFPLLFTVGIDRTSAAHGALVLAVLPLFTGFFAALVERTLPPRRWWIGCAVALAGEIILMTGRTDLDSGGASLIGDGLVIGAAVFASLSYVAGARLEQAGYGSWGTTFWGAFGAGIILAPVLFMLPDHSWMEADVGTWAGVLYLAAGSTILAYIAWYWALGKGGIGRIGIIQFLQPVVGVTLAVFLLGDPLTVPLSMGAVAILGGVFIAQRR